MGQNNCAKSDYSDLTLVVLVDFTLIEDLVMLDTIREYNTATVMKRREVTHRALRLRRYGPKRVYRPPDLDL